MFSLITKITYTEGKYEKRYFTFCVDALANYQIAKYTLLQ